MNLETLNYGTVSYDEENIVVFEKPLLGFNNLKKFVLVEIEQNSMFNLLQSIEEKAVGFIVLSPFSVRQDYEIELDEATIKELEIESHEDVAIMTTVTLNEVAEKTTTNLKAPIIINIKNKKGKQIILNNDKYKIKEPLMGENNMLVLSRKKGESILIGENIEISVMKIDDGSVKLSINAPKEISILRKELVLEVTDENKAAIGGDLSLLKLIENK